MKEYTLVEAMDTIQDPRRQASIWYPIQELLFQIFVAVLCNAKTFTQIRRFVSVKWEWFLNYIPMEAGLPDESTYRRALAIVDPVHVHKMFSLWMRTVAKKVCGMICIDGKTERGSRTASKKPAHIVSALCETRRQVLAQVAVKTKSNEITAIPLILDMLVIRGCIVSFDALGTQYKNAQLIHDKGAFYLFILKDNQRWLQMQAMDVLKNVIASIDVEALPDIDVEYTIVDQLEDVPQEEKAAKEVEGTEETEETDGTDGTEECEAENGQFPDIPCTKVVHLVKKDETGSFAMSKEDQNGRIETRKAYILNDVSWLTEELQKKWGYPTGVGVIFKKTENKKTKKTEQSERWFFYSIPNMTAEKLLLYRRGHWSVEEMHNTLDVVFLEDACHASWENIAENLNVIRHCALNVLKEYKGAKCSIDEKRYACSIDLSFLKKVLEASEIYPTRNR